MSKFKITGPGFYKMQNGQKAEVVGRCSGGAWMGIAPSCAPRFWSECGSCNNVFADSIIAPWTEPKKGTVWVNVYDDYFMTYTTRDYADRHAVSGRLACVSVNWTEGEGL